jgi:hypothetical protein
MTEDGRDSGAVPVLCRRAVLAAELGLDSALLRRLDRARLIPVAAVDRAGMPLLDPDAVARLRRLAELVRAGYTLPDIAHVLGRGTVTRGVRPARLLLPTELGIAESEAGTTAVRPDAHRDDGAPLFHEARTQALAAVQALVALGLPDLAAEVAVARPTADLVARLLAVSQAHIAAARALRQAASRLMRTSPRRGLLRRRN